MKVLFYTEFGKIYGYGHISRCIALSEAFELKSIKSEFIIKTDKSINDFFHEMKKNINIKAIDWTKNLKFVTDFSRQKIVIVDSYIADKNIYDAISKSAMTSVFFDDFNRINYPKGIILNSAFNAKKFKFDQNNTLLLGFKYCCLRKPFWNVKPKINSKTINSFLITLGGSDQTEKLIELIKFLEIEFPHKIQNIIITTNYDKSKIYNLFSSSSQIKFSVNPSIEEIINIYKKSDIAISTSGHTLNELLTLGIPVIGFSVVENQILNGCQLHDQGFINYIGDFQEKDFFQKLKSILIKYQDYKLRKKVSCLLSETFDGLGALRTVKEILGSYYQQSTVIKKANKKYIDDIWSLSNQDYVRQYSINPNKITYSDHIHWFNNIINKTNYYFYIICDNNDRFLGNIRFEVNGYSATISISLEKKIQGLGLSSYYIVKGINKLLENVTVKEVKALIHPDNKPSIKSFSKAGFIFVRKEKVNNKLFNYYLRKCK